MPKLPPAFTLRVLLVVTQIVSALGISALALIQPVLPAPLMSLQPLVGAPQKARADVDLFAIRTALPVANTGTGPFPVVARGTGPADPTIAPTPAAPIWRCSATTWSTTRSNTALAARRCR